MEFKFAVTFLFLSWIITNFCFKLLTEYQQKLLISRDIYHKDYPIKTAIVIFNCFFLAIIGFVLLFVGIWNL